MKFLKRLRSGWKSMTGLEKAKLVTSVLAQIGGGLIGGDIARQCCPNHKTPGQICVTVAGIGLGSVIGNAAANAIKEDLDGFAEMIEEFRKDKEAQANG